MFSNSFICLMYIALLLTANPVLGRERWLEREDKPVFLHPRRFGQENPPVLSKLSSACGNGICATLAGQAISTLLGGAAECAQQDMADQIIDASSQFDAATQANMIALAVEFRQAEKNTPPDFTTNPPTLRNSVFCQKAPKNPQLNGLVQAQDPSNNPNVFFDPATQKSVLKGSQANTFPFGAGENIASVLGKTVHAVSAIPTSPAVKRDTDSDSSPCSLLTVTVGATDAPVPTNTAAITVTFVPSSTPTAAAGSSGIGNFGSCSIPEIEFGVGFDGRKETSFQPVDKNSYDHGSADDIDIITQFICDNLTNKCNADQTAKNTCATAKAAADSQPAKTGAQADAFNAVFGISTDFASIASVDDQGRVVPGTGSGAADSVSTVSAAVTVNTASSGTTTSAAGPGSTTAAQTPPGSGTPSSIGNFGKCSVPRINFAVGFDNRKETSFEPADQTSYPHGSADDIDIITQFICDTLTNTCGADQTAKNTCASAQSAADTKTAKTGAQADAFNAVFGISTDFSAVAEVDDQGNVVGGTGNGSSNNVATQNSSPTTSSATSSATSSSSDTNGNLQKFTGSLGGVAAPAVTATSNGQFQVEGNSSFNDLQSALLRSCDVQNNNCANAANSSGNQNGFTVSACQTQSNQCDASAQ